MPREEKIGVAGLLRLKRHGGQLYVTIPKDVVATYRLERGDVLRIDVKSVVREEEA